MKDSPVCPACGAEVPAAMSGDLCPACLLGAGLDETDGTGLAGMGPCDEVVEQPGDRIGPYELLESIGEGGFGMVFRAVQKVPVRREVAVKVMKPGMDSREIVARFEAERQALALMEHSHIAKVHDAGTTPRGRPYFVMELVDGRPLTSFCDRRRLTIHERLELFGRICSAVQHAHQKGIIHRDLKPSNILVIAEEGGRPRPKIIDFGVAKAVGIELTEQTFITLFGRMLGTPEYMSPEQSQLNAVDVDTRSDIYSLGVVLYELLCGRVPVGRRKLTAGGFDRMCRMIREEEPPKPSNRYANLSPERRKRIARARRTDPARLDRVLHGDLDWIVMKALEKDPERRYRTIHAMAVDIRRYLRSLPVHAGPPSTAYRVGKFVKRNRGGVAIFALVVVGLVAGIIATSVALHTQRQATRKALVSQARDARQAGASGWMQAALDAIEDAADIRVDRDLRDEALAALAGTDMMEDRVAEVLIDDLTMPIAYDADHRRLAIGRPDRRIEILESGSWKPLAGFDCGTSLENSWFRFGGTDGQFLVVVPDRANPPQLEVHDWQQRRLLFRSDAAGHQAVERLPDHRGLRVASGKEVRTLDWGGNPIAETHRFDGKVVAICGHPDSGEVAVSLLGPDGSPQTGRLAVLAPDGAERTLLIGAAPTALAWDPGGRLLAIGYDDGGLTLLSPDRKRAPERLQGHEEGIQQIAWSSDGLLLASSSEDLEVRLHDRSHHELLSRRQARAGTLSFDPDNRSLGPVAWNGTLINLAIRQSSVCHRAAGHIDGEIHAAAWDRHRHPVTGEHFSLMLATAGDDGVRLWNRKGRHLFHLPNDVGIPHGLAFSGQWIYQAGARGIVRRECTLDPVSATTRKLRLGPVEQVAALEHCGKLALSPAGDQLAVAGEDCVWLVDTASGESTRLDAARSTHDLAIDWSGRWLAAGTLRGRGVRIWRLPEGAHHRDLDVHGPATVAFSPDLEETGTLLAAGDSDRNEYRFWRAGDWSELGGLSIPNDMAKNPGRMAFSPRGTAFVVSHAYDQLMVLDPRRNEMKVMTQPNFDKQWPLKTSCDGALMATEGHDGRLFLWDLAAVRRAFRHLGIDWEDMKDFKAFTLPVVVPPDQPRENNDNR